jgi:sugar phosphate isomerase/epimerase
MRLCATIPTEQATSYQSLVEQGAAALASLGLTGGMFGYREGLQAAPIRAAFARAGVVLAEMCLPYNLCSGYAPERERIAQQVTQAMGLADEIGCGVVAACSGGFNERVWIAAHPRNFTEEGYQAVLDVCRRVAGQAERRGLRAVLCIEPLILNVINSAEQLLRLVDEVGSPHVQAHMDAANLMTLENYFQNGRHITRWFDLLGPRVRSAHAKDSVLEERLTLHIAECLPGQGGLDWAAYLAAVAHLPEETPLVIEHVRTLAEIQQAAAFLRATAARLGLRLL